MGGITELLFSNAGSEAAVFPATQRTGRTSFEFYDRETGKAIPDSDDTPLDIYETSKTCLTSSMMSFAYAVGIYFSQAMMGLDIVEEAKQEEKAIALREQVHNSFT